MTGSLQIKNGVFYAVLNFKDKQGKRKQKWISTGLDIKGNKRKAEQFLNEAKIEYSGLEYLSPTKVLFCDFIKEWVDLSKMKVQVTTYDNYVHMLNRHIYPYFKEIGVLLSKIKPMDIELYYNEKLKTLSPNTVIKHHGIIRSCIAYAVKNHLIKENVADLAEKPKRQRFVGGHYSIDELNKLFTVARNSTIETPIIIAAFYGLRRSEVLGLRWDFEDRIISVRSKVIRGHDEEGKLIFITQDKLKSESSYRSLPLCDFVYNYLKNLKEIQLKNKQQMGSEYDCRYQDYICVNQMGTLISPDYVTSAFAKLLKNNCLRHNRYHDLRHSCATLLVHLGFNLKDVQEWLGHSDFLITANTYTHVDMQNKIKMINTVSKTLSATSIFETA